MKLIIVRHGEAGPSADDFNRVLTPRGRDDIAMMSALIRSTGWTIGRIACSPLVRARQTADVLAERLNHSAGTEVSHSIAPGFQPDGAAAELDAGGGSEAHIWCFHAPDVARMASYLTGLSDGGFYFTPGTMLALNLPSAAPDGRSLIVWKMQPEFMRDLNSV